MSLGRRQFLQASAGAAVAGFLSAGGVAPSACAEEAAAVNELPIVDTHQHLWDLKKFRLPWLENVAALRKSYLPADYAAATEGLNVVKTVYMEVDVDPEQQDAEAEYVLELCRDEKNPMSAAVISGRPGQEGFAPYIKKYQGNRYIKGVRQVLHVPSAPKATCLAPDFVRDIQLLGELGMSFDLCMRPEDLADAAKLIGKCPDTRFILDHCGNRKPGGPGKEAWEHGLQSVARQPNVVCKVSGIVANGPEKWDAELLAPTINFTLETFGPDRVMFGGDWPVCTLRASYRQWVDALKTIVSDRPQKEQKKLFHDNAVKFYGLG